MVADVAGHGQEVAETARTLRGLIRRFMNHIDQRRFVSAMNEKFSELTQAGRFATAVVMTFFSPSSELSVCNAGHPPPLVFQKSGTKDAIGTWRYLDSDMEGNIPLGILGDTAYEQFKVQLNPGDLVLTYTDSLIESVCRDGTLLGEKRLLDLIQTLPTSDPTHIIHHLLAKFSVFGATMNDDVTLLLTQCTGPSRGASFFSRLGAQLKFLAQIVTLQKNIPWPELSLKNLGGAIIPSGGRAQKQ
jgi:serine phosphatase RsbU (regulator of sigma subunit)